LADYVKDPRQTSCPFCAGEGKARTSLTEQRSGPRVAFDSKVKRPPAATNKEVVVQVRRLVAGRIRCELDGADSAVRNEETVVNVDEDLMDMVGFGSGCAVIRVELGSSHAGRSEEQTGEWEHELEVDGQKVAVQRLQMDAKEDRGRQRRRKYNRRGQRASVDPSGIPDVLRPSSGGPRGSSEEGAVLASLRHARGPRSHSVPDRAQIASVKESYHKKGKKLHQEQTWEEMRAEIVKRKAEASKGMLYPDKEGTGVPEGVNGDP